MKPDYIRVQCPECQYDGRSDEYEVAIEGKVLRWLCPKCHKIFRYTPETPPRFKGKAMVDFPKSNPLLTPEGRWEHIKAETCPVCDHDIEMITGYSQQMAQVVNGKMHHQGVMAAILALLAMLNEDIPVPQTQSQLRHMLKSMLHNVKQEIMQSIVIMNHGLGHEIADRELEEINASEEVKAEIHKHIDNVMETLKKYREDNPNG